MATSTDPRLAGARRFGLEIGAASVAAALWLAWRGRYPDLRTALLVAGIFLSVLGVLRPAILAPVAGRWLALGHRIATMTTPIILALIYFLVVTPLGVARRTLSRSPIRRDPRASSYWVGRPPSTADERRSAMEHQF